MTTDVRLNRIGNLYDLGIDDNGDLENGDFFDSSLLYSLLGERRADASEVPNSELRRGWIGDEGKDFENGSKLWLYYQARLNRDTLNGLEDESFHGLKWFIDDEILANVTTRAVLKNGFVALEISLFRFNSTVDRRFFELWNNTGA